MFLYGEVPSGLVFLPQPCPLYGRSTKFKVLWTMRGHYFYRDAIGFNVYCFGERDHAEQFCDRFDGEMIAPEDRPKWSKRRCPNYRHAGLQSAPSHHSFADAVAVFNPQ